MSPVHVNGRPPEVSRPSAQHGAIPIVLAEPELGHVAVERPAVEAVRIDDGLERERRAEGALERLTLDDVAGDRPVAPDVGLESAGRRASATAR